MKISDLPAPSFKGIVAVKVVVDRGIVWFISPYCITRNVGSDCIVISGVGFDAPLNLDAHISILEANTVDLVIDICGSNSP